MKMDDITRYLLVGWMGGMASTTALWQEFGPLSGLVVAIVFGPVWLFVTELLSRSRIVIAGVQITGGDE